MVLFRLIGVFITGWILLLLDFLARTNCVSYHNILSIINLCCLNLQKPKTNELQVFLGAAPSSDWTYLCRNVVSCTIVGGVTLYVEQYQATYRYIEVSTLPKLKTDRRRLLLGYQGSVSSDMAPKTRTKKVDRSNILILIYLYTRSALMLRKREGRKIRRIGPILRRLGTKEPLRYYFLATRQKPPPRRT